MDVLVDMGKQGKVKPSEYRKFCEWIVLQEDHVFLCGMMDGSCIQPIHSVINLQQRDVGLTNTRGVFWSNWGSCRNSGSSICGNEERQKPGSVYY